MDKMTRQTLVGYLLAIGAGIALGVALDNIAVGIGVGLPWAQLSSHSEKNIKMICDHERPT